jgi:hypothetical protein
LLKVALALIATTVASALAEVTVSVSGTEFIVKEDGRQMPRASRGTPAFVNYASVLDARQQRLDRARLRRMFQRFPLWRHVLREFREHATAEFHWVFLVHRNARHASYGVALECREPVNDLECALV